MKKHLGMTLILATLASLASNSALAGDAVLGALIGGGAGAVVGSSIGGRDAALIGGALGAATGAAIASSGTRIVHAGPAYYAPPPPPAIYVPAPVVYPQQAYYAPPVRVERRVYYVESGYGTPRGAYGRYERRYERHHDDWHGRDRRDDGHRRGWDARY